MGLAHAYHAARAGKSVVVFERSSFANGASVRNFGMLAIIAQRAGSELDDANYALGCWRQIAPPAGIDLTQAGCLFVAREPEEMQVLTEFTESDHPLANSARIFAPDDLSEICPGTSDIPNLGGLWSPDAWKIDQRKACAKLADWLRRAYGVAFHFSTDVSAVSHPALETSVGEHRAGHIIVCGGDEFSTLFPEALKSAGVVRCQLQMLRTRPQPKQWKLDPFVLGGLSMARYGTFSECRSLPALSDLQQRHQKAQLEHGIHVIACQEVDGGITMGDSHAFIAGPEADRSQDIDDLIQMELANLISLPDRRIAERWLGHYAHKAGTDVLRLAPSRGVSVVTMTNGQGMTHAFSVSKRTFSAGGQ